MERIKYSYVIMIWAVVELAFYNFGKLKTLVDFITAAIFLVILLTATMLYNFYRGKDK